MINAQVFKKLKWSFFMDVKNTNDFKYHSVFKLLKHMVKIY